MSEQAPISSELSGEVNQQTWRGYTCAKLEAKADKAPRYGSEVELTVFRGNSDRHDDLTRTILDLGELFGADFIEWQRYVRTAVAHLFEDRVLSQETITRYAGTKVGKFLSDWSWDVMPIEDSNSHEEMDSFVFLVLQLNPELQVKIEARSGVWRQLVYTDPDTGAKYWQANQDEEISRLIEEGKDDECDSIIDYNTTFTAWFSRIVDPNESAADS